MCRRVIFRLAVVLAAARTGAEASDFRIDFFRLRTPGDAGDIGQGSDLHYGRLGGREGLWLVCDRNGGESAGKLYLISAKTLQAAGPGEAIVADEEFTVAPPRGEWSAFAEANKGAGQEVLDEVRKRITPAQDRGDEPFLDLEAVTIAPSPSPPHEPHVFVVAEEPFSTVLELVLERQGKDARARLAAVYAYAEGPEDQGSVRNDGIEGFAYAGTPGEFYFAEEATRKLNDEPRSLMMFSLDPRLGRARLENGRVRVEAGISDALTDAVRTCRKGRMQTLNALTVLGDGRILCVDRNGGWINRVDPARKAADQWLNLYDVGGKSLRELLARFPGPRQMPYVSIEGIAVDEAGAIWLLDDPAIPEGWRESCLVRITGVRP